MTTTTMTHRSLYNRISTQDLKAFYWMTLIVAAIITSMYTVLPFIPESWLENYGGDRTNNFFPPEAIDNPRFVLIPEAITSTLVIILFVSGIVTAAENRAMLGAGVTRKAAWIDGRVANIGIATMIYVLWTIAIAVAVLLDGGFTNLDVGIMVQSSLTFYAALLVAFELGYAISMLFCRYHWFGALIAAGIGITVGILIMIMQRGELPADWAWYTWLATIAFVTFAFAASRHMLLTLPMRRSS